MWFGVRNKLTGEIENTAEDPAVAEALAEIREEETGDSYEVVDDVDP